MTPGVAGVVRQASVVSVAFATTLWFATIDAVIAGGAFLFAVERSPESVADTGGHTRNAPGTNVPLNPLR